MTSDNLPAPVQLDLCGIDGNAFMVLGAWKKQARREGWTSEQISQVIADAKSGDYSHLICTIQEHCDPDA